MRPAVKSAGLISAVFLILGLFPPVGCMDPEKIQVENVDIARVSDGRYEACHELPPFLKACVAVIVRKSAVTSIEILKHECGRGRKAENPIIEQVIGRQSLRVDTVSGATGSSKLILKAVEKALKKGMWIERNPRIPFSGVRAQSAISGVSLLTRRKYS